MADVSAGDISAAVDRVAGRLLEAGGPYASSLQDDASRVSCTSR
jgi:hypothetical protein